MTQLSKNFTLSEFTRSATAQRSGYKEQFDPPALVVLNLRALCENVLQPLREAHGQGIFVSSGYRCERLNKAVKGAKNSQHLTGEAADISTVGKATNADLFRLILALDLPFDQLIWEFGSDVEPDWIHISYSERNRRQVLRARRVDGETVYTPFQIVVASSNTH